MCLDLGDLILILAAMLTLAAGAVACFIWSVRELGRLAKDKGKLDELYGPLHAASPPEQKYTP
jgi:hypothetical protein